MLCKDKEKNVNLFPFNKNEINKYILQLINKYIQAYSLRKAHHSNPRQAYITNFESVKTIGLLSNPKNTKEIQVVDQVIKQFEKHNKQIFPLIYIDHKMDKGAFAQKISWSVMSKENCNWFGNPKKDSNLDLFIDNDFDILIDLSFVENFSLQSIFIQSKARLKIMQTGKLSEEYADLMLKTSNPYDKLIFADELIHYLMIINKDTQ